MAGFIDTYRCKCLLFAALLSFCMPAVSGAEDIPSPRIRMAAEAGLDLFIKSGRSESRQRLGFSRQEDIDSAALGQAFNIHTIPPDKLLGSEGTRDPEGMVMTTGLWQFLIVTPEGGRALLSVDLVEGVWTPVSIGSSGLARELGSLIEAWPASAGYSHRIIRIYQAKADLVEISKDGKVVGVIPMGSALATLQYTQRHYDPRAARTLREIIMDLRPAVERNIGTDR